MSTTQQQFSFNIAFTVPVNGAGETPILSTSDLWESLRYGARHPHEMAPYIANGEVLPGGSELEFRRRLTVADGGAVHTAAGGIIYQDVVFYPMLSVEATTTPSGAKTTFAISRGTEGETNLYLTALYQLKVDNVEPGSEAAEEMGDKYTELARGACSDAVKTFRRWKTEGRVEEWAKMVGKKE